MGDEKASSDGSPCVFTIWREYESIAMHFNQLIANLRMRALGGSGVIVAIVSLAATGGDGEFTWGLIAHIFWLMLAAWCAIFYLDCHYYDRLLMGAVRSILEIEEKSAEPRPYIKLNMSSNIQKAVVDNDFGGVHRAGFFEGGRSMFYTIIATTLVVSAIYSTIRAYLA